MGSENQFRVKICTDKTRINVNTSEDSRYEVAAYQFRLFLAEMMIQNEIPIYPSEATCNNQSYNSTVIVTLSQGHKSNGRLHKSIINQVDITISSTRNKMRCNDPVYTKQ